MDTARLCAMAEQIARNLAVQGDERAIAQTADHIRQFWDPRMKAGLLAADPGTLSPLVARAVERLRG